MNALKLALWIFLGSIGAAHAEVSFFSNITAQAEAENSAVAKEEALAKAERQAFLEVAGRLTDEANVQTLDQLTDEQLQNFILEVSVVSEKNTSTSYQAELNIEINGSLLKQYMQENDMIELSAMPVDVVIIPVYVNNVKLMWEDGNIWRKAWLDKGQIKSGNLNFKVLPDQTAYRDLMTADNAADLSPETYRQLSEAENTENVFTVTAVQAGRNTIVLVIKSFPGGIEKRIPVFVESGSPADKAIADTVSYITQALQPQTVVLNAQRTKLTVSYEYPSLKEWLRVEKKLKQIPQIKAMDTGSVGNGHVQFEIDYAGQYDQLVKALEEQNLKLTESNGKYILQ
jgi:hypothetical protein